MKPPAVRWFKEWVPQDLIANGGKCSLLKWVTEDALKSLKEKCMEPEKQGPEPTTEVLFLCSYEGCGKSFLDVGALRKHTHVHGERQYVCHYDGCGKKFMDSSKLKRHFLTHTGERHFICPYEGCGKAFSLDFNLRSHMRTHSPENYHVCPCEDCGKRYTNESKLNAHIKAHHGKSNGMDSSKHFTPVAKTQSTPKTNTVVYGSASSDRPYVCPHQGCGKDYIHEYKLNLHLKKEHLGHNRVEENGKQHTPSSDHDMDEASEQDTLMKKLGVLRSIKRNKPSSTQQMPPSKVPRHNGPSLAPTNIGMVKKPSWPIKDMYEEDSVKKPWPIKDMYEEDSEETEEDGENDEDDGNDDDDETEDEE